MNALKDGKSRNFHQILDVTGFSLNTLRLYLTSMVDEGLVDREKMPLKGRGRPMYLYSAYVKALGEVVALRFGDLKRICRHIEAVDAGRPMPNVSPVFVSTSGKKINHH